MRKRVSADRLYARGNYAEAYEIYAKLPFSYRIHENEYAAKYKQALELANKYQYEAAAELFAELGNYQNSPEWLAFATQR